MTQRIREREISRDLADQRQPSQSREGLQARYAQRSVRYRGNYQQRRSARAGRDGQKNSRIARPAQPLCDDQVEREAHRRNHRQSVCSRSVADAPRID